MNSNVMELFREVARKGDCECGAPPVCDTLECLCRPRFYPGQLLTDEDLKRLEYYIVAKNRLHNRHLHGAGVVCGLEVVCKPCDSGVSVRAGYALGPCGEDIVVCDDAPVPIANLINEYRSQSVREDRCGSRYPSGDDNCEANEQEWVLSICYEEQPKRGVTSLKSPSKACSCGCSSKNGSASHGHSKGGCGCGGGGQAKKTSSCSCGQVSKMSAQCEPTLTCEGYRFVVAKAPNNLHSEQPSITEMNSDSLLAQRVMKCLMRFIALYREVPSQRDVKSYSEHCCLLKRELAELIQSMSTFDCTLLERLNAIQCPKGEGGEIYQSYATALAEMYQIAIDLFKGCICSALLPPCAVGGADQCIPLATVRVRTSDLKVLSVCNWSVRKFAVTMPMLGYWLDWLSVSSWLRWGMTNMCCDKSERKYDMDEDLKVGYSERAVFEGDVTNAKHIAGTPAAKKARSTSGAAEVALQHTKMTSPLSGLEATVLTAMGLKNTKGESPATDLEIMNPMASFAFGRLAPTAFSGYVPTEVQERFERARSTKTIAVEAVTDDRVAKLEEQLAVLKKTITTQDTAIKKLIKERNPDA